MVILLAWHRQARCEKWRGNG